MTFGSVNTGASRSPLLPDDDALYRNPVAGTGTDTASQRGLTPAAVKEISKSDPSVLLNYQINVPLYGVGVVCKVIRRTGRTTRFEVIFGGSTGMKTLKLKRGKFKGDIEFFVLKKV